MIHREKMRLSAVAATTATLVPVDGERAMPDFADTVASVVVTFTNARDDKFFDVTNRRYRITIERE